MHVQEVVLVPWLFRVSGYAAFHVRSVEFHDGLWHHHGFRPLATTARDSAMNSLSSPCSLRHSRKDFAESSDGFSEE